MSSKLMRAALFIAFLLAQASSALAADVPAVTPPSPPKPRPRVVAYVPNWVDLNVFAESIPYDKLTHINIAFENPTNDDGDLSFSKRNDALIARARAAGVKVLISIGGGSAANDRVLKPRYFRLIAADRRAAFVAKLTDYVVKHGFDGLDADLEGPSINDDYGAFIADLSAALKPKGKLLTAALAHEFGGKNVRTETFAHFDFINIMAYDAKGSWNMKDPGQHSSMEFAKKSVNYWLKRGLPKEKAVLGVPFYGYGFGADKSLKGNLSYARIVRALPGAESKDEAGDQIFYNGIPTIRAKARYVLDEELGGLMIWSLDNDAAGEKSLLAAMDAELKAVPAPPAPASEPVKP